MAYSQLLAPVLRAFRTACHAPILSGAPDPALSVVKSQLLSSCGSVVSTTPPCAQSTRTSRYPEELSTLSHAVGRSCGSEGQHKHS